MTSSPRRPRVVVVPDSFKGSATAAEVADAMVAGVRAAARGAGIPEPEVRAVPFADGGEGTLDALLDAWGSTPRLVAATDALGRPARARWGLAPDGATAIVEAAEVNGLPQVSDVPLQPLAATTRGVGTVVRAALDAGCSELLLCIGGSATTDGGAGLLRELGVRFLDVDGRELPDGGGALERLHRVDAEGLDPRAAAVRWRIACDVTNPLVGERGAAAVFSPQKGATPVDVAILDRGLRRLAAVLLAVTGVDVADLPGAGAAGGLPAGLHALLGAELAPGGELVAAAVGLPDLLADADLVLTGEGRLDQQSFHGKVVDTVRRLTPAPVPVVAVAGSVTATTAEIDAAGLTAAFSIARGPASLDELRAGAVEAVTATTTQVVRVWLASRTTSD
ncbi:glycerate kinase [Nocardioides zeae]|uniref:Glycerate kinase n=1 Tax=Nocardioides zeae TaxID=1457234 RepID=A0ACC6IJY6_9ACTN|nr:glycerate kinase [Nocardioides zeae]MDR6173647.1 glycerate kinase [Nocardioides zeae]MDR6211053.1 glycerate kinase [Nocardioides zeae]